VVFLTRPSAHADAAPSVGVRETHMSWVFFVGDTVLKLKKPVRFAYLDFSTLARREAACRAEATLNRALAPGVYLGVKPVTRGPAGLAIGGSGEPVDWLVVMRRLDDRFMLDRRIAEAPPSRAELMALVRALASFYRRAGRVRTSPALHALAWRRALDADRAVLLTPRLGMPAGKVRWIDAVMRRFLRKRGGLLARRVRGRRIVDAHGDLRPEHVWLGGSVKIIDRLEFNAALREADPLDELGYLELECERLGAAGAGAFLRKGVQRQLHDEAPEALLDFYRSHRAMLRARLSIAHLLEANPRTPDKWPRQARAYLALAAREARRLERALNRPAGR